MNSNKIRIDAYNGRDAQMIMSFLGQCIAAGVKDITTATVMLDNKVLQKRQKNRLSPETKAAAMILQAERKAKLLERKQRTDVCPECGSKSFKTDRNLDGEVVDWCKKCSYSRMVV